MIIQRHINISATTSVPLFYSEGNEDLERVVLLPQTALAADVSNYFTVVLKHYEGDGTAGVGVPLDEQVGSFSTALRGLVVGRPVILPQVGFISEAILKDTSLYAVCTLTGTATLDVLVQLRLKSKDEPREDPVLRLRRYIASFAGQAGYGLLRMR